MKPLKASDLYRKLKAIEERVRRNENPDGSCNFEIEKVYLSGVGTEPASGGDFPK